MKIKWQWFIGGQAMFWIAIIMIIILIFGLVVTYGMDPTTTAHMKVQSIDASSVQTFSETYVACCGIEIDKPIVYRFVRYRPKAYDPTNEILLGTFHEWNGTYYIDISVDLYKNTSLNETVIHETRHMIVEYLRDQKIIDLTAYTEEIAQEKNKYYNDLFNSGVYLLQQKQEKEKQDD